VARASRRGRGATSVEAGSGDDAALLRGAADRLERRAAGTITDLNAPSRAEFEAAVARGEHAAGKPETMLALGKMQLAGFLEGLARCEA
jgi:hypothetical protein